MLPFCEDDLPREVCQAQVRNITCFMHKQLPGEFKLLEEFGKILDVIDIVHHKYRSVNLKPN